MILLEEEKIGTKKSRVGGWGRVGGGEKGGRGTREINPQYPLPRGTLFPLKLQFSELISQFVAGRHAWSSLSNCFKDVVRNGIGGQDDKAFKQA